MIRLILIVVSFAYSNAAFAQNLGINFAAMPKGTKMVYEHSDGKRWVEVYTGKKGKYHVVKRYKTTRASGRPAFEYSFDSAGRLKFYRGYGDRAKSYKLTYQPYACQYQAGRCRQKEKFSGTGYVFSGQNETWGAETRKIEGQWTTVWFRGSDEAGAERFSLGKYNLRSKIQWLTKSGLKSVTLISIQ